MNGKPIHRQRSLGSGERSSSNMCVFFRAFDTILDKMMKLGSCIIFPRQAHGFTVTQK